MAGSNIKGITIQIGADTQPLTKALDGVNKQSKDLQSELKQVDRLLKLDPTNTTLLAQKQKLLADSISGTKDKLDVLKTAEKQVQEQFKKGDIGVEQYRAFQREVVNTETNLKSLEKQAKHTGTGLSTSLNEAGDKLTSIGKKASVASVAIVGLGGLAVKSASDLSESVNKVDVAFGDSADSVKEFGESSLKSFGLAKGTALDTAALFGDMGTSMGLPREAAAKMSMSLTGLAGDLSSFKNIGVDQATTALNGVFTGETESLKMLGIVMTQANLDAFALANGYDKTTDSMTEAEKVNLRYAYVMNATKNAQGDFARTSDGTANSIRIMQESTKELSAEFGEALLPIITPIIQKLTEMVQWFSSLDGGTKSVILTVLAVVAVLGPLLTMMGTLITVFGVLAAAQWATILPIMAIIAAIGILIAIGVALYQNWDFIAQKASEVFSYLGDVISSAIDGVIWAFNKVVDFVMNNWQGLLLFIVNPFAGAFKLLYDNVDGFKEKVDSVFSWVKDFIGGVVKDIMGFFDFDWSLPNIKMPHFKMTGEFDMNPLDGDGISVPTIGVDWYAKGGILTRPTIFGMQNGNAMGGGEAGAEAILPISSLDGIIASAMNKAGGMGGNMTITVNSILDGRIVSQSTSNIQARTARLQNA